GSGCARLRRPPLTLRRRAGAVDQALDATGAVTQNRYELADAAPGVSATNASSDDVTPRGRTMTGHCASAARRRDTPPSRTARIGPYTPQHLRRRSRLSAD